MEKLLRVFQNCASWFPVSEVQALNGKEGALWPITGAMCRNVVEAGALSPSNPPDVFPVGVGVQQEAVHEGTGLNWCTPRPHLGSQAPGTAKTEGVECLLPTDPGQVADGLRGATETWIPAVAALSEKPERHHHRE